MPYKLHRGKHRYKHFSFRPCCSFCSPEFAKDTNLCGEKKKCDAEIISCLLAHVHDPFKVMVAASREFGPEGDAVCYASRTEDHVR